MTPRPTRHRNRHRAHPARRPPQPHSRPRPAPVQVHVHSSVASTDIDHRCRWRSARDGDDRGSVTVELVLLTPLLILLLLFVVALGRLASARLQVDSAASQAARAASLARDPETAIQLADTTAAQTLTGQHHTCARMNVAVDTTAFTPGGHVAVTVTCTVDLADLSGLRLPATHTVSSRFVEPLDTYRGTSS